MKKTYTDEITQKIISYDDSDVFIIKTRYGFNKKTIKKIYQADKIDEAIKDFYSMPIRKGAYKYLFVLSDDVLSNNQEGTLLLRMKGSNSHSPTDNLRLKSSHYKGEMRTSAIANLTKCPAALASSLSKEDFTAYPASISRWTNVKLIYCLLAYYLDLSWEAKKQVLKYGEKNLFTLKELSGHSIEEENKVKVDVVTKDDLL